MADCIAIACRRPGAATVNNTPTAAWVLPYEFATEHGVILADGELLHRAGLTPEIFLEIRRVLRGAFTLRQIDDQQFQRELTQRYQSGADAAQRAADEFSDDFDLGALVDEIPGNTDLLSDADNAPVIRLINAILSQAVREKASDIHLEPGDQIFAVRFRVDGVLRDVLSPKAELGPVLASRLKVMARLDIAEKRLPQDGRITVRLAGHAIDIRLSTIPSSFGERVVLRLLDQAAGQLQLAQLDLPAQLFQAFSRALHKPHGIILVTGPTGSGKTTTLYAGLHHVNSRDRNILTIEDPVEYVLPGIGQTQVNPRVDMTFAKGLRAILRQDPDIVMVGEIRDSETASIAVQASLTGHLVLSTLHTNTAVGAVTRLLDMGIEPFLLSSSLQVIVAQRLVRKLCSRCREPASPTPSEQARFGIEESAVIYKPVGCEHCNNSGYRGRTGIYELIEVDEELRQMIHDQASEQSMLAHVRKFSAAIDAHGQMRVQSGETSIEEVLRVTAWN